MNRYVPINKMSKRKQRELYKKARRDWGGLSPFTRKPPCARAYNRAKMKREEHFLYPTE